MKSAILLYLMGMGLASLTAIANIACARPDHRDHRPPGPQTDQDQMTLAKAQREIRLGMSSAEVVEALGSPNMVTTDSERRETWVYDRVSTEITSSRSQSGVWLLVAGAGSSSARVSQSQKTLTIIVKFDENGEVRDFAYKSSSF
jgi:outer membrane protein assembly factor BamE (lipoprotein component of BamABCDE complex)